MAGSQPSLNTVARLRADAELEAGKALREAQQSLEMEEERLVSVQAMLADYENRAASGSPRELRDTRHFITRLHAGVISQVASVDRQKRITEAARAHWISARLQREAIDRVIDERRAVEAVRRERAEQRQVDDRASRLKSGTFIGPIKGMEAHG